MFFNYHKFAIVKLLKNHGQHGWINVYLHHQLVKINIAEFVDVDQSALYLLLKPLIKQQCYQTNPAIYYMALETFKYYYHHHYPFITTAISADV